LDSVVILLSFFVDVPLSIPNWIFFFFLIKIDLKVD